MRWTTTAARLLAGLGSTVWLLGPRSAWAQAGYEWPGPMHWMWGMWGYGMALWMLAFWGLIIAGLVYGVRWLATQGRSQSAESPLDIVKRRYARGEITREEFDTLKRDLG